MWLNDNMPDEIIALKDWSWKFKKKMEWVRKEQGDELKFLEEICNVIYSRFKTICRSIHS